MAKTIKKHQEEIEAKMRAAGTYRPDFEMAVKQLAVLLRDQELARKEYRDGGSKPPVEREGKFGAYDVKNPLLGIMETQTTQISNLLDKLGLTPSGLKKINDEMKKKRKPPGGLMERVKNGG